MRNNLYAILAVAVLSLLAGLGSLLLFRLLESEAHIQGTGWSVGGAAAGFILLYKLFERTFQRIYRPVLPGDQALALIHLFTDSAKADLVRCAHEWLDAKENGEQLPPMDDRLEAFNGIRHKARQYVTCFVTPFGDLNKRLEESWSYDFTMKDVESAMETVESDIPSWQKRKRLWEIADSNQNRTLKVYADDLRKMKEL